MYPGTLADPKGKLRLLYEAFPLAFLVEAAGGRASNGSQDILDYMPVEHHERTPLFLGNTENVNDIEAALSDT